MGDVKAIFGSGESNPVVFSSNGLSFKSLQGSEKPIVKILGTKYELLDNSLFHTYIKGDATSKLVFNKGKKTKFNNTLIFVRGITFHIPLNCTWTGWGVAGTGYCAYRLYPITSHSISLDEGSGGAGTYQGDEVAFEPLDNWMYHTNNTPEGLRGIFGVASSKGFSIDYSNELRKMPWVIDPMGVNNGLQLYFAKFGLSVGTNLYWPELLFNLTWVRKLA